jgi:hypothetical protein
MNLRQINKAVSEGDKPTIRQAFRMLVAYPELGRIDAASPGFLVVALNKVCAALEHDTAVMPPETCDAFRLGRGNSYEDGVNVVRLERTRFSQQLIERFAA